MSAPARRRAVLAGGLALVALVSGLAPAAAAAPPPASARTVVAGPLEIVLQRVPTAALDPRTALTITGTVRNTGSRPATDLRLSLARSFTFNDRAEVARWAQDEGTASRRLDGVARPDEPLAPGASAPFTLTVPPGGFGLPLQTEQPLPMGLEVQAEGRVEGSGVVTSRARTFAVWQPGPVERPLQLALVAPVTAGVAARDAGAATAHPAATWSPTGRLSRVLQATAGSGFSYAVDPAVLAAATAVVAPAPAPGASPSPTPSPSGTTGPGTVTAPATSSAAAWLRLFGTVTRNHDVVALPWADTDLGAVVHADGPALVQQAESQGRSTLATLLGRPVDSLLWPAEGRLDAAGLHALATRADRRVLLDGAALPEDATADGARVDLSVTARRRPPRVAQAVVVDPTLSALLADADTATVPRLLAELAAQAATSPGATVVAVAPRDWEPDVAGVRRLGTALKGSPWVSLRPFSSVAADTAPGGPRALPVTYGRQLLRRELPAAHVAAVGLDHRRLEAFAPALVAPEPVVPPLRREALSFVGLGWRGRAPSELALARTPLTRTVDSLYEGLSIDPGSTKNLLAEQGFLPISVRNSLPYDVQVRLVLQPRTGQLSVPDALDLRLAAGRSQQVPVPVRALANGDVTVVASFRTPNDRTMLHEAGDIQVRVRSDWEGRGVLVVAALLALLLVVGLARGVRRGRTRIPPEAVPDPDDVGLVAVPEPGDVLDEDPQPLPAPAPAPAPDGDSRVPADAGAPGLRTDEPSHHEEATRAVFPVTAATTAPTLAASSVGPRHTATTLLADEPTTGTLLGARTAVDEASHDTPAAREQPADIVDAPPAAPPPTLPATPAAGPSSTPPGAPPPAPAPATGGGEDAGGVVASSALMAAGTLLSRILGMVRVVVLAWAIGLAVSANAFTTANTLPNSLFLLIGGGVLNAILVPQIVRAMQQPDGGQEYVDRLLTLSLTVLAVATVVVTAAAPLLLGLYVDQTWTSVDVGLGVAFAFWCLPQVFFYGLYTVLGQVLNARGSFGPYMWAPVVNNVVAIAGMIVFVLLYGSGTRPTGWWSAGAVAVLAGTTTLGVVAQALVLVPVLRRSGFRWRPRWGFRGVGLRSAGHAAAWTFGALVVGQLGLVVLSRIANRAGQQAGSEVGTGRSVYDNAFLLFMLPHSLVAVSVVTAVFTRMSQAVVAGRLDDVRADLSLALRTTGVATVLATAGFAVLGPDLTAVLFATNPRATTEGLAWTTTAMAVGLAAFSAQYLFQRVFYAFSDARTPFWVQVLVVSLWTAGNLLAGWRLEGVWVVVGIGAAMSVANLVGAAVTMVLVRRRVGGVDGRRVASLYTRCTLAAGPAAVVAWAVSAATHLSVGEGTGGALAALTTGAVTLVTLYVLGLRLLRVRELDALAAPLRRLTGR